MQAAQAAKEKMSACFFFSRLSRPPSQQKVKERTQSRNRTRQPVFSKRTQPSS
jgi:guanylate kinase